MGDVVDRLGPILLDGAVSALALVGTTALLMVVVGQPARRLVLGRMAVLGLLAILPLAVFAPIPRFSLRVLLTELSPPTIHASLVDELASGAAAWRRSLVGAALGGLAIGLGWLGLGGLGARRLLSQTIEPAPETQALYEDLPLQAWCGRPPVRVSVRVRRPVLVGTFRATILIPPDLEEPNQDGPLRLGLLHELAHFERHDPLFGLASGVAGALWFFVPPLWWTRRQMRLDQEFLADRRASERFGAGASYARSLLGMAEPSEDIHAGERSPQKPGAGPSALFHRVLMLIRSPYPIEPQAPAWWAVLCASTLACGTVIASGLSLREPAVSPIGPGSRPNGMKDHGLIEISRMALDTRRAGQDGRIPPHTLLRALPPRFELIVDVLAAPADMPLMAIAGLRLGPVDQRGNDSPSEPVFHKVRIVRDDSGFRLWVDNRPISPKLVGSPPSTLLSVQPAPGRTSRYRNLLLTW